MGSQRVGLDLTTATTTTNKAAILISSYLFCQLIPQSGKGKEHCNDIHTHTHTHIYVTVPSLIKKKKIELDNTRNLYSITMGEEGDRGMAFCLY